MSPFTCPGGPPTLLSAEHTGRQSRAKIASVGSTLKGCLCSHTQCAMMSSWHFKLSVARMPSATAESHSPVGAKQVNGPRKNRPRESEAEPFLIIISFPILIKPPPPLTRMFTKPPNWPPCFRPGPLGPPVYLQQGSQRNPAKPKAGPAAAIILQRPPFTRKKTLGVPVFPGTMRPTTPTFQASCPTSLSPPQQWSRRPPGLLLGHTSITPEPGPLHKLTPLPARLFPGHPGGLFPHLLQILLKCHLLC